MTGGIRSAHLAPWQCAYLLLMFMMLLAKSAIAQAGWRASSGSRVEEREEGMMMGRRRGGVAGRSCGFFC